MKEHKLTGVSLETQILVEGLSALYTALERDPAVMTLPEDQNALAGLQEPELVPLERAWKQWRSEQ